MSGGLEALAMPPLSWIWLHPFAFVPGLLVVSRFRGWRAFLLGWAWGVVIELCTFWSLVPTLGGFSELPLYLSVAVLLLFSLAFGVYMGVFAFGIAPIRRASGPGWPAAVAAWFVACEFLNPQLFYYYQGSAWFRQTWIFLVVALLGQAGMSFLVLHWNVVLAAFAERWREAGSGLLRGAQGRALRWNLGLAVVCIFLAVGFSLHRLRAVDEAVGIAPRLRVALIQANQTVQRHYEMSPREIAMEHVELSEEALLDEHDIEVLVWPEGAISGLPEAEANAPLLEFLARSGVELWTGSQWRKRAADGQKVQYNSGYRLTPEGVAEPRYDKNLLLPFGEYMPLKGLFPSLGRIPGVGSYVPGTESGLITSPWGRFAFLICYEAVHSSYVRRAVTEGADWLVNISYDGWFGRTNAPYLHLMMSAVQAAQYGLPMARAATTGVSALVDPAGRILQESHLFEREALVGELPLARLVSPYARMGNVFAWTCVGLSLLLLLRGLTLRPGGSGDRDRC
jgi:apolipoprotein N-acyltransferase